MAFLAFFTVTASIILGWTYGITIFILRLFPLLSRFSTPIILFSLISSLFFLIGVIGANAWPNMVFTRIYQYGAIWLGGVTISGFIAILFLICAFIFQITYGGIGSILTFVILVVGANIYGLYLSFTPKITEYTIHLKGNHTWHGKKIIMVADTHYGNIYDEENAQKLVHQINSLSGEIVLIPGDFFDGPKIDFIKVANEFSNIQAPYGVIFSNGNHEEYRNTEGMLQALEKAHIQILNNKKITLNGLNFAGVTYTATETEHGLRTMLDAMDIHPSEATILLKHKPSLQKVLESYPIDLVVSGHTHRGQMWPFSLIPRMIFGKYSYGFFEEGRLNSITTSGVGTWGPPQRIGSQSEIVVIHIE